MKKSLMSAWRRSTCSTRKTSAAACRLPGAAAAAAEVAGAAEVAVLAEVAPVAQAAAAVAACRGVLAEFAELSSLLKTIVIGRVRLCRPGQFVCSSLYRPGALVLVRA
jgi:hypothetical protein